jgi:hypothetical protein
MCLASGEGISSRTPLRVRLAGEYGFCDAAGNWQKYQCRRAPGTEFKRGSVRKAKAGHLVKRTVA